MSHIYRLIIGPHKHVCNAIWANLDWFWRESNCLIENRSFLCHLTYNLRYQENFSPWIYQFWIYCFWISPCVMGYGGNLEPTPSATLHIFATLQIFAHLCYSADLIFLNLHFKCQHFPNIWRADGRQPLELYDTQNFITAMAIQKPFFYLKKPR